MAVVAQAHLRDPGQVVEAREAEGHLRRAHARRPADHEQDRRGRGRVGHDLHRERVRALDVARAVEVQVEGATDPRRPGDGLAARRPDRLRQEAGRSEDRGRTRIEEVEVEVRPGGAAQPGNEDIACGHLHPVDDVVDGTAQLPDTTVPGSAIPGMSDSGGVAAPATRADGTRPARAARSEGERVADRRRALTPSIPPETRGEPGEAPALLLRGRQPEKGNQLTATELPPASLDGVREVPSEVAPDRDPGGRAVTPAEPRGARRVRHAAREPREG